MQQQINLYQDYKKAPVFFLNFQVILIIYGIFSVFLLLDSSFDFLKNNQLRAQATRLSIEQENEKNHLAQVKEQYPMVNLSDLEGSMQQLKQELGARGEMAAILSHQTQFSAYLAALGYAAIQGVWLTDIQIMKSGQIINLKGMATKGSLLETYIMHLKRQPIFAKVNFSLQEVIKSQDEQKNTSYVSFTISGEMDHNL